MIYHEKNFSFFLSFVLINCSSKKFDQLKSKNIQILSSNNDLPNTSATNSLNISSNGNMPSSNGGSISANAQTEIDQQRIFQEDVLLIGAKRRKTMNAAPLGVKEAKEIRDEAREMKQTLERIRSNKKEMRKGITRKKYKKLYNKNCNLGKELKKMQKKQQYTDKELLILEKIIRDKGLIIEE